MHNTLRNPRVNDMNPQQIGVGELMSDTAQTTSNSIQLHVSSAKKVNFAAAQNSVSVIKKIELSNQTSDLFTNILVRLEAGPAFFRSKVWQIDRIAPGETLDLFDLSLDLDLSFFSRLNEAETGQLVFSVEKDGERLTETQVLIELLAKDEWGGIEEMPQLIAAFVAPNDPAVARIVRTASILLEKAGQNGALNGYQSADPKRSYMLAGSIWSAVAEMSLSYAQPPSSFEKVGQKIRSPHQIAHQKLATCLDTTLLVCSALEAVGLNPVVIFTEGHCFAGVWLKNQTLRSASEVDVWEIRKAIECKELWVFETTLLTQRPVVGFAEAVRNAAAQLDEAVEEKFEQAIDIKRSRDARIRPLARHADTVEPADERTVAPPPLPQPPDLEMMPADEVEDVPDTPRGRIERWQRKLLDLSLRNRLLNFSDTKQTVPLHCPDIGAVEDILAADKRLKIISLKDENPVGLRAAESGDDQTAREIENEFADRALDKGQICVPLTGVDMSGRLTTLYRKAKSDLAEGGANTLFLAAGFLRWKKSPTDKKPYRAPILLLPVRLERRSATSDYKLVGHDDDIHVNNTLLQMLEKDFSLKIPVLEGDLPEDHSGYDLPKIFSLVRAAVREAPGFEVLEQSAISTFSFAKYLMWKDLVDRTEHLKESRLVRHLIENPDKPFDEDGIGLPEPRTLDRRVEPAHLHAPLPADSSQLAAVVAAERGHDMVVIGPPGTGKSQTIANMIAHCLAAGKTVLFVSEKSAALEVVHRRLKQSGLGDACLELHSNKADRKSVINQLGRAWDRAERLSENEWVRLTSDLKIHRDQLNAYAEALHAPGSHGVSVFEAIGIVANREPICSITFPSTDTHDAAALAHLRALADRLEKAYDPVRGCSNLESLQHTEWSFSWQEEVLKAAGSLRDAVNRFERETAPIMQDAGISSEALDSLDVIGKLYRYTQSAGNAKGVGFEDFIDKALDQLTSSLDDLSGTLKKIQDARAVLSAQYTDEDLGRIPVDDLDRRWREADAKIWPISALGKRQIRKLLQSYANEGNADPASELQAIKELQSALPTLSTSDLATLPLFAGENTQVEGLRGFLSQARTLQSAANELVKSAEDEERALGFAKLLLRGDTSDAMIEHILSARESLQTALERFTRLIGKDDGFSSISAVKLAAEAIESAAPDLAAWTRWAAIREEAALRGLAPLVQEIESGNVGNAVEAFNVAYFTWWLPRAMDERPVLRDFSGYEHQHRIDRFRELDEQVRALASEQIRRRISHDLPTRDGVPRKSELGTLRHQLGLQRPSAPIRALIGEMPTTFTKLAPCVLMSPLSVAQYLPTRHKLFDLVIFDEASQITTWDAIGAVARGRQSIIVGDPKQLPPTNFFGRTDSEEDEELQQYEKDLPSILDEATVAGLPTVSLNWHYRSRDESLIAFSNHHYYGDRLVTFPSPKTESDAVVFHQINGVYARGQGRFNQAEAEAIAAFTLRKLKSWLREPEENRQTLGVITFNTQQQELILDHLDKARRDNPEIEWFFDDAREEPVVVRNLENVQGDERDVMLFSITFGRDKAGKMSMSFGAINKQGGEKRLNVAVTRARGELHVFSSINANDIDLGRTKALGVEHLKGFLDFAERGAIALPATESGSMGSAESPFESAVLSALSAKGWDVRTQIGVSGFRIDLGVVHPDKSGAYLAAVECDGATYHRSATARDRDEIRESVLRNLGWEIVRVWSTDWFKNQSATLEQLHSQLEELLIHSREEDSSESETDEIATELSDQDATANELEEVVGDLRQASKEGADASISVPESEAEIGERATHYARHSSDSGIIHGDGPGEEFGTPDPDRFHEQSYTAQLEAQIEQLVSEHGPLAEASLIRSVARAHGWQRAGRRIQERVVNALGQCERHLEDGAAFIWAKGSHAPIIPFRAIDDRSPREVPRAEIRGLLADEPELRRGDDPALALARAMGINRLSEDARSYLEACLAEGNEVD